MKKLLNILLMFTLLLVCSVGLLLSASATEVTEQEAALTSDDGKWSFTAYGDGVQITAYHGTATDVYVPFKVTYNEEDYAVLKLADSLFENNDSLNSVTLGDGIVEIGAKTFYDCDNLVCIVTNESLTTIGAEAFYSCDSFNSVILYDAVSTIDENAFAECPSLTIWCNEDTDAHTYATENSIPYEILNPDATPETYIQDGVTYYIANGEAIAIGFDKSSTEVVLCTVVSGYPVTRLHGTFKGCGKLISVTLPKTLQAIEEASFSSCRSLQSVTIPESVTIIGSNAFYYCSSLQSVIIPNGVTVIGSNAFYFCSSLQSVIIPEGITSMENFVFAYCRSLQSITIPEGVTSIRSDAFSGCNALRSATIPESVNMIESDAFKNCRSLQTVIIPKSVKSMSAISFPISAILLVYDNSYAYTIAVDNDLLHFVYDGINMPMIYSIDGVSYYVKDGSAVAFSCEQEVTTIEMPAEVGGYPVTELRGTFIDCENLGFIALPDTLRVIGEKAFYYCNSLYSITIPEGVTVIGNQAFYNCTSLQSVIIPDGVTVVGDRAFSRCRFLESVTIPEGVICIGYHAFSKCSSLQSVTIPKGLTSIGSYAFSSCSSLQSVDISEGIACIENYVFSSCTSLQSVTIPQGVTSIGSYAFSSCSSLQNITIPDGVITIGSNAFLDCGLLQKVIVPKSIESMCIDSFPVSAILLVYENSYAHTFAVDNDLLYFVYDGTNMPSIYTADGISYYLTDGLMVAYDCDQTITTIKIPSQVGGYPVTELRGTFMDCEELVSVTLPDTLQVIGAKAFYCCTSLQSITIPNGVRIIGSRAFYDCDSLQSVAFSDGLRIIGSRAFYDCDSLQSITIPVGVTIIESAVFYGCHALHSVTIPEGVTTIESDAFSSCPYLQSVTLPESVTNIGNSAFSWCYALQSVTIPSGVTSIASGAFSYCYGLESVTIPEGVTTIESRAFAYCHALRNVTIPESVTSIGNRAFICCCKLQSVTIPSSLKTVENEAFSSCSSLQKLIVPKSVDYMYADSFPVSAILIVYEDSYAHTFAEENDLLYFVMRKTENPEISYGAGISGTVTYLDGSSAAGATVEIFYDDGVLKESVVTDENGAYEFTYAEVGAYTIRVTDANGNIAGTQVSVKRMNAFDVFLAGDTDLKLKKGYTVSGTVDTYPATVTITDENGNVLGSMETTDGSFSFENIPNGTYIITATTENGGVSQEITVFDGDMSDIILTVTSTAATLWGYVEVEDREYNHHRRNWVEVTVYNADGIAVAQSKTDKDGKYTFIGLPVGEYAIVAETAEMRPDHKHGFDRSHTLTGYAYIDITEAGTYQVETIVLREENDNKATISGKVTAHGETQNCQVVLHNVFRSEIASMITGKNGKYSFKNVSDGLYFITATTQSDGMGFAVVTVRDGKVYGETDITVYKSDKIKDREDRFHNDIPECGSREDALKYRDRIAEEKRFYDGLSHKEKKQLSKDYVNRLDRLTRWITDCNVETGDGVTMEQGGLVISGEEVANAENITFTLNVTPSEAHNASTDGVNSREDQIYHNINDKSNKHDVLQYYDITLSKEVDGVSTQITSVTKDTEANGKLRITMEIPEEYRGYKHYTVIHEHCGDVVTLTDLDDDPNTVTFEVDKFSTFVLAGTNITLTEIEDEESTIVESWGLTLTDNICVNFMMFADALADDNSYVEVTVAGNVTNISAAEAAEGVRVEMAAAQMTEAITLCVVDGSGNRSQSSSYTVRQYCDTILEDESYSSYHALVKEMLNYGGAAQSYFDYNTENLASADITDVAAEEVPETADALTVDGKADGVAFYGASLVYRDRIAVRYYFTGDVSGVTFTANGNTYTAVAKDDMYYVEIADILPQNIDQQITLTVTDADDNVLSVSYGPMNYIMRMNEKGGDTLKALVKALYNYHLAAKAFATTA